MGQNCGQSGVFREAKSGLELGRRPKTGWSKSKGLGGQEGGVWESGLEWIRNRTEARLERSADKTEVGWNKAWSKMRQEQGQDRGQAGSPGNLYHHEAAGGFLAQ